MKIPYGISDYEDLITNDYYYLDKTMYLEKIEDAAKTLVYLRPRRFGKTLFTSMMYYYYDVNSKDKFDTLFKDTYVYNNPTPYKNNYYILKFDFSGMSSFSYIDEIEEKFKDRVLSGVNKFMRYYNKFVELDDSKDAATILSNFFDKIDLDNKIYIIIDEYDNFTNSILSSNTDLFKKILGTNGFVKDFYARIKEYSGTIIDRTFITGVCSISLDSMTSGFNIATNITNDYRFNSMTALTHEEVKKLIDDLKLDNKEEIFNDMLENYDGYCFNRRVEEKLFNPTLTMYYLNEMNKVGLPPEELLDNNIISNYEQIKNIISLGDYKEILDDIYDNGEIVSTLTVNFDLNSNFSKNDIVSLLYYFGYLTINSASITNVYNFKIPNKVMKKVYSDYYMYTLKDYNIITEASIESDAIIEIIEEGKIDKFCSYVSSLLKKADNRIYINFKEKDLQILMYAIITKYEIMNAEIEYKSNDNYIDLMILKNKVCNYNIMIELKYIKKSEETLYDKVYNEAIEQINRYSNINIDNLKKYVVVFIGSDYNLIEIE